MAETTIQPPPEKPVHRLPPRARRSFLQRTVQTFRARARETFSREQLIASLKSLGWVAPMTVLIWIYAEREQVDKQVVQFHIEARNNDPTRLVELEGPGTDGHMTTNFVVRAEFSGPKKRLDDVTGKLEGGGGLQIENPDLPAGHTPVSASSLLKNHPLLIEEGLTITSIVPSQIEVVIDKIERRPVRVSARPTVTNLDGPPNFTPATIEVTGPKSVLDAAGAAGKLVAYADLPALTEPGSKSLTNVPVTVPIGDPHVSFSPTTVTAEVTVKKSDVDGVITGVPVWAIYPPLPGWDKYKAEYEPTLAEVKVSGPPDAVGNLNNPALGNKPRALLDLKIDGGALGPNLVGKEFKGTIHYELGDSRLKVDPDAPQELVYKIVER